MVALAAGLPVALPSQAPAQSQRPAGGAATVQPPLAISLQQALDLGLAGSLSLRGSALEVQSGQALVGLARSRFLPKLDLVGLGTWAQVGTSIGFVSNLPSIGDLNLNLGGNGYAVVQNTFVNAGLVLRLPVVDFTRTPLMRAARAELDSARSELSEQQRRSRFDIISAYLFSQLADAQIPVWQKSVALSTTLLRDATAIRRRGLAARIDTLQAQALLQTDMQGLAEAQAQQTIARSALARVLNLPPEQVVTTRDPLVAWPAWTLALEPTLDRSLADRPALAVLEQQRQAQLARVQLARAERLPSVGLLLGGGISGDWLNVPVLNANSRLGVNGANVNLPGVNAPGNASGSFYDYGLLLSLRQPLFDGGQSRSASDLAERRAERTAVALDQARQAIVQNVQTWYANHQAAGPQMAAASAAAGAGEEAVRDALLRYRAGIAPISELLLAQRNLQLSRTAQAVATHRWNLSRAGLELETGLGQEPGASAAYSSQR